MKTLLASLVLLVFAGCGSSGSSTPLATPDASAGSPDAWVGAPDAWSSTDAYSAPDVYVPDAFVDPLIGTWIDQVDTNNVLRLKFDGTNYEVDSLSLLTDGTYGMRIDQGTYSLPNATTVNLRLRSSTCQGVISFAGNAANWTYTKSANSLSVTTSSAFLLFQRGTTSPTGMGIAALGCFKDDGTFIAHSSSPVP